jgi:hypothetical protein
MNLQKITFYSIWIFSIIIGTIAFINYYFLGIVSLNLQTISLLVKYYPTHTMIILFVLFVIILIQYKRYKDTIKQGKNCQIRFVELEKIAHNWQEHDEIEARIMNKINEDKAISFDENKQEIQSVLSTLFLNRNIKDVEFYKKYVFNHFDAFTDHELEIVASLYEILETKAKNLPSVATLYKKDTDVKEYQKVVTDNLRTYDILYKVNLFEHTMHVVENIYELMIKNKDSFIFSWARALISALAHDIGKIEKIESLRGYTQIDSGKYQQNNHEALSRLILSNAFPDYQYIEDICEIVEKHHISELNNNGKNYNLIKLLKTADQFARKNEINEYLIKRKEGKLQENEIATVIDVEENTSEATSKSNKTNVLLDDSNYEVVKLDSSQNESKDEPIQDDKNEDKPIQDDKNEKVNNIDLDISQDESKKDIDQQTINLEKQIIVEETKKTKQAQKKNNNQNDIIDPKDEKQLCTPTQLGDLIELIVDNVNVTMITPTAKKLRIASISKKDKLYMPTLFFYSLIKKSGIILSNRIEEELFIKKLKSDNLVTSIVQIKLLNFKSATYSTMTDFVEINLNSLGITPEEAEMKKRENDELKNVNIIIAGANE